MCIILASLMELFRVAIELIFGHQVSHMVLHHLLCSGLIHTWQATHSIPPLEMSSSIYYRLQLKFHNDSFSASIYFPSTLMTYQLCALPTQHQCSSQMTLPSIYVIGSSHTLSSALNDCHTWMTRNKLKLNTSKSKCVLVYSSHCTVPPLKNALGHTRIE